MMESFKGIILTEFEKMDYVKTHADLDDQKIANILGVSHTLVSFWKSGKRNITEKHKEKIDRLYKKVKYGNFSWGKVIGAGGILAFLYLVARGKE